MFLANYDYVLDRINGLSGIQQLPNKSILETVFQTLDKKQKFASGRRSVQRLRLAAIKNLENAISDLGLALTDREDPRFALLAKHPEIRSVLAFLMSLFSTSLDGQTEPARESVLNIVMDLIKGNMVGPKAVVYLNGEVERH